jgi:hypothetical protein
MKKVYVIIELHEGIDQDHFYFNEKDANEACKKLNKECGKGYSENNKKYFDNFSVMEIGVK